MAPDVIEAAFAGGPYGKHGLRAVVDLSTWLDGPPARATGLQIDGHLLVQGRFFAPDGSPAGEYRRMLYKLNGEWELWLGGLEIWQVHRGRGAEFQDRNLEVAHAAGVARARLNAGGIGAYSWARRNFELDDARLPGWGTIYGVGLGGERVVLPADGESAELRATLIDEIIAAARRSRRLMAIEAATLRSVRSCSLKALADLDLPMPQRLVLAVRSRRERGMDQLVSLSRRLLVNSSWPGVREPVWEAGAKP